MERGTWGNNPECHTETDTEAETRVLEWQDSVLDYRSGEENEEEALLKEIMGLKFPNLVKGMKPQIQELEEPKQDKFCF